MERFDSTKFSRFWQQRSDWILLHVIIGHNRNILWLTGSLSHKLMQDTIVNKYKLYSIQLLLLRQINPNQRHDHLFIDAESDYPSAWISLNRISTDRNNFDRFPLIVLDFLRLNSYHHIRPNPIGTCQILSNSDRIRHHFFDQSSHWSETWSIRNSRAEMLDFLFLLLSLLWAQFAIDYRGPGCGGDCLYVHVRRGCGWEISPQSHPQRTPAPR